MANGFGSFYVGTSGLQSSQNALNVVANNLANVDTDGYVRQQVIFSDKHYSTFRNETVKTMIQQSGIGVSIGDVVHARDIFLDQQYRLESGRENFYEKAYTIVTSVEDIFQELDGEELKDSVENMRQAFQQLAIAPGDSVNQNLVIQNADTLLSRYEVVYENLSNYQKNLDDQIKEQVDDINEIGKRIFELNQYIQKVEAGKLETAMTARDERDYLVDKLAGMVKITCEEENDSTYTVNIEGTEFVTGARFCEMALVEDKETGFNTPYWPYLSDFTDKDNPNYSYVFSNLTDISTEFNTDVGELKCNLFERGDRFGKFVDLEEPTYSDIQDCTLVEREAQIDSLIHNLVTGVNDLLCPNIDLPQDVITSLQGGSAWISEEETGRQYFTALDDNGKIFRVYSDAKMLDTENCTVGADGKIPAIELFERVGCERYSDVTVGGITYHVYNEEQQDDESTWYAIGSVHVKQELKEQESLLPTITQNGAVDYEMADKLARLFDDETMVLNPNDNTPCTFEEFYNKMINDLGTFGDIYYKASTTLSTSVESIDSKRQQVIGVSSDEELTHMIKYQSAYNAASRFINVINEMTELIVGLI